MRRPKSVNHVYQTVRHSNIALFSSRRRIVLYISSTEWVRVMQNKDGGPLVSQTLRVACALQYRNMPLRSTARQRMPSPIQEGSSTEGEESDTERDSEGTRSSATYEEKVR